MKTKRIIIPFLACLFLSPVAFAEEVDVAVIEEVAEAPETLVISEDQAVADLIAAAVAEAVAAAAANAPAPALSAQRANAAKTSAGARRSSYAEHESARVGMVGAAAPASSATANTAATAAAVAAARLASPKLKSGSTGATDTTVASEELECSPGEKVSGSTCVLCDQKNNPGVEWANPGQDCTIYGCVSDEYELVKDSKGNNPKCLKKCEVWGGVASKEWKADLADFDVCGSGKFIECSDGFVKTNEQTSASGRKYWHCIPTGTMSGACKRDESVKICNYMHSQASQRCENGYWGVCNVERLCDKGYKEDNRREVYTVLNKEEKRTAAFDCVEREK